MKKLITLLGMLTLLLAALPTMAQTDAHLRVGHFSLDAGPVDVFVDGEVVVSGLEFAEVTAFLSVAAGQHEIAVTASGDSVDDAVLGPVSVALGLNSFTTVGAVGLVAEDSLDITIIEEDLADVPEDQARITVVHTLPAAPNVDVLGSGILLIQSLSFPSANSDGAFTRDVPPGTYDFDVTVAENADAVLIELDDIFLAGGESYLIVALGTSDAPQLIVQSDGDVIAGFEAEEEADAGEASVDPDNPANVRVGHFSFDAGPVDVFIDGEVATAGLVFAQVTDFITLEAGEHEIAVAPEGSRLDDAVIGPLSVELEAGSFTMVGAVGLVEDGTIDATLISEDLSDIPEDQARITVVHALADNDTGVDLIGSGVSLIQSLRFPSRANGRDGAFTRDVPPGTYDFDVTVAENADAVLLELDDILLEGGASYLIVALGIEGVAELTVQENDLP